MPDPLLVETVYNTRWWGARFGRVTSDAFFDRPAPEVAADLSAFSVVEFSTGDVAPNLSARLAQHGFWWADCQLAFRIGLREVANTALPASVAGLRMVPAAERPFTVAASELPIFKAERFRALRGITATQLAQRYANWSNDLIAAHPDACFEAFDEAGNSAGWFLGKPLSASTIELTLAMVRPGAGPVGGALYQAAIHAYAHQGYRLGRAAFSVQNTDVLNIYSQLGARFVAPAHIWLWQHAEN